MDASGGNAVATTRFDPRFQSILVHAQSLVVGLVGAVETEAGLVTRDPPAAPNRARAFGTGIHTGDINAQTLFSWRPPHLLFQNRLQMDVVNTDTGTLHQFAFIFLFNIRVYEEIPLNVILASLPSTERQNVTL